MKETVKKIGGLTLKSQLNRNQQKKITGGRVLVFCGGMYTFTWNHGPCPMGYCEGTGRPGPTTCI